LISFKLKKIILFEQVSPSQTVSTEEVRAVDLSMRRCYFPGEGYVTGLPVAKYQQDSCFMACRMHFLAKACNCTPYFFPRTEGTIFIILCFNMKNLVAHVGYIGFLRNISGERFA